MKKNPVIHPFLLALYPVIFLYAHNAEGIPLATIINPGLFLLGITSLLFFCLWLSLRQTVKTGLIVSAFVFVIFAYGHVHDALKISHQILIPFFFLIWLLIVYQLVKTGSDLRVLNLIINVFAVVLVIFSLSGIVSYQIRDGSGRGQLVRLAYSSAPAQAENKPDIYYIIFDRYANNASLKNYFSYDNHSFTDYLKNRGFFVDEEGRANYLRTYHSLASSLNMQYINILTDQLGEKSDDWLSLYHILLNESEVSRYLKQQGYQYIHSGSFWEPTKTNNKADINLSFFRESQFSLVLYEGTIFHPLTAYLGLNAGFLNGLHRRNYSYYNSLNQFDSLEKISNIKKPTFTFVHLLIPHDPYVFDENGSFPAEKELEKRGYRLNYLNQLKYANQKITKLIDQLTSQPENPPIIILQSDEGPYPEKWVEGDTENLNWQDDATDDELKLKTGILNAYYLPGLETKDIPENITPVNTFRFIFNKYFQGNFDLLPDKTYAHFNLNRPYQFFEITDRLK